ncbi:MAG: hypothetical protein GY810_32340 [Aureispira sp.]|nr:hypothetical protein [Aureispira sp.]
MAQFNVTYAHFTDEELLNHILLEGDNPLAVELANRLNARDCEQDECEQCGMDDDNIVAAEDAALLLWNEVKRLMGEIK